MRRRDFIKRFGLVRGLIRWHIPNLYSLGMYRTARWLSAHI